MDSCLLIKEKDEYAVREPVVEPDADTLVLDTDEDDGYNPYLNARVFEIHRTSDAVEVDSAIDALCAEFGKSTSMFKVHLKTLVCDLYHNHVGCSERYVSVGLAKSADKFKLIRRYNKFCIGYRLLAESIDHLKDNGYIEYKRGYLKKGFANGFQTRIRATEKLAQFLESHHVNDRMIHLYADQELVVRKKKPIKKKITTQNRQGKTIKPIVKIKLLDPYEDNNHTRRWRNTLERYNELIADTYIDLDLAEYKPTKLRKKLLFFDMSRKRTKRSFSNGNFISGGRFYGGVWQSIPSDMRPHLLVGGRHVVENDFSGMHIHILYAMIGKRLSDTGLEPYMVPKDNDPEGKRPYYKKLLLSAINAKTKWGCVDAVKKDIKKNLEDYPEGDYDLWAMLDEIIAYHPELEEFLLGGEGLHSQYVDSCIAYRVIKEMTDRQIPVLCIHDSFISADVHADIVLDCMRRAYVEELNLLLKRRKHKLRLTPTDSLTDETTIIQRRHPSVTQMIGAMNTMKPLELITRSRTSSPITVDGKPLYQSADRDKKEHFIRIGSTADKHQKQRQFQWIESGKAQSTFNETIIVDVRKTVTSEDGTKSIVLRVFNKTRA